MDSVVVNRAGRMRVLLDSKQHDASFGWIEGEAPPEYAGEPCPFTDNVKRVLIRGLSWYQFKEQHGYFNFLRGSSGLHLQNKTWSLVSICRPLPLWLKAGKTGQRAFVERSEKWKQELLTTEWSGGQSTSLKRWRPFRPHPVARWVGDTLAETWCGRYQRSELGLRWTLQFIWKGGNTLKE